MRFQRVACGLLLVTLATPVAVVRAADDTNTNPQAVASGIRVSIDRAAASVAAQPASFAPRIPLTLPRQIRVKKGMGIGMMLMSVIGTAAGIAGTYYMVKTMKDQANTTPGS